MKLAYVTSTKQLTRKKRIINVSYVSARNAAEAAKKIQFIRLFKEQPSCSSN